MVAVRLKAHDNQKISAAPRARRGWSFFFFMDFNDKNAADGRLEGRGQADAPQRRRPASPQGGQRPTRVQGGANGRAGVPRHASHAAGGQMPPRRTAAPRPNAAPNGHPRSATYRPVAATGSGQGGRYHGDDVVRVRKKRKSHRTAKRVAIIVAAVLFVLIGAAAAFGIWYTNTLSSNMAMNEEDAQKLDDALGGAVADVAQEPFYVLVMGSDNWETYGERSDAMILTRVDPVQHVVTMVSVPRDTPYELNGSTVKINQAFAEQGPAGAVTAVQDLTGVDISYYVEIEFAGLAEFIDSIGGIYVDVPYAIDYQVYTHDQEPVHLDAGEQLLNGEQCVALARSRTDYSTDQDAIRQSNIRAMVLSLMNSVLQSPPAEIPGLVQRLSECISTNMDLSQMMSLATDFAGAGGATVYTCTGPYEGDIDPETGLWLCYEDPEGWAELMEAVDAGQNPETVSNQVEGK